MHLFLLVNNASTVRDATPVTIYTNYEEAIAGLAKYEQTTVFRPIILYEYVLENGSAIYPKWMYRREREGNQVELTKYPVNPTEFRKSHPFVWDKGQSMFASSLEDMRA